MRWLCTPFPPHSTEADASLAPGRFGQQHIRHGLQVLNQSNQTTPPHVKLGVLTYRIGSARQPACWAGSRAAFAMHSH